MALEIAVPARRPDPSSSYDESVASFFTRRLGRQAYERVVEPLLAGIHAGDAHQLSLPATFPRFADQEREHGGLLRATFANRPRKGAPAAPQPARTAFVSFRNGMATLPETLAGELTRAGARLLLGQRVDSIRRRPAGGYDLGLVEGAEPPAADAVVLATPAYVSAPLLADLCPAAALELGQIAHASTATVSLAYERAAGRRAPEGYGFVVPRAESRDIIAATWNSQKWPGRAPAGQLLLRGYVGGVGREPVLDGDDGALIDLVRRELAALGGITGEPVHTEVHRFPLGMPQYTLGHRGRVERARAALAVEGSLAVAGAAYGGVGIPDCIADATATVVSLLSRLTLPAR
jgi:oxygen-dependent protoporphyrinogen oxidase